MTRDLVVLTGGSRGFGKELVNFFSLTHASILVIGLNPPVLEVPISATAQLFFLQFDLSCTDHLSAALSHFFSRS